MQKNELHVMSKLGKACDLLKAVEALPETKKCAGAIQRARLSIEEAMVEMQKKKVVNWRKVSEILGVISKVFDLLKLLGLGEFINFCNLIRIGYAAA